MDVPTVFRLGSTFSCATFKRLRLVADMITWRLRGEDSAGLEVQNELNNEARLRDLWMCRLCPSRYYYMCHNHALVSLIMTSSRNRLRTRNTRPKQWVILT